MKDSSVIGQGALPIGGSLTVATLRPADGYVLKARFHAVIGTGISGGTATLSRRVDVKRRHSELSILSIRRRQP